MIGSPVSEEDRMVESYGMLVTALEASAEVPQMEVVTERLLHEERKLKERGGYGWQGDCSSSDSESVGLLVCHVLSATTNHTSNWIVDSGTTCHMCNDPEKFSNFVP